jgi:hypothetical protein
MPRSKAAWSAWNFLGSPGGRVSVTYWLNKLQVSPARLAHIHRLSLFRGSGDAYVEGSTLKAPFTVFVLGRLLIFHALIRFLPGQNFPCVFASMLSVRFFSMSKEVMLP